MYEGMIPPWSRPPLAPGWRETGLSADGTPSSAGPTLVPLVDVDGSPYEN